MHSPKLKLDEPAFSFAELCRLTGLRAGAVHAYVMRRQWCPVHPQRRGVGGADEVATYCVRDVLRLLVVAACTRHRVIGDQRNACVAALDIWAEGGAQPSNCPVPPRVFELRRWPWCTLRLDLAALVRIETARMQRYVMLRGTGVVKEPNRAA